MSGISSIPPLLCSTPPPMDFGDEEEEDGDSVLPNELSLDGEYNDFAVTTKSHDNGINPDVPSLPGTPDRLNFNELSATRKDANIPTIPIAVSTKTPIKPVEAFNLAISTAMLRSNSPPPLEFDDASATEHQYVDNGEEEEDFQDFCIAPTIDSDPGSGIETTNEDEDSLKNEDNVSLPSLKFDTLSINSDKLSGCSPTSPSQLYEKNADQNETKDQVLQMTQDEDSRSSPCEISNLPHGVVKMEDILDDTSDDDTHSPKLTNNINAADNTIDFFAIHAINADRKETHISDTLSKETLTTGDVVERDNNLEISNSTQDLVKEAEDDDDDFDNFTDFTNYQMPITETVQLPSSNIYQKEEAPEQAQSFEFDADFGEFVTTTPEHQLKGTEVKQLETLKTNEETFNSFDEDNFEDFQDFTAAPSVQQTQSQTKAEPVESLSQADDTEDEFGDFSDAQFTAGTVATTESSTSSQNISTAEAVSRNSLNDKLKPILNMMFPSLNEDTPVYAENTKLKCAEPEISVLLNLDSIDAAKALDYQWTKSEVRHSLIRSLGIDSRNILFGDKWNSSMPRFAACLQPLEPLKPQQVSQNASSIVDAAHSNSKDRAGKTLKPDVPAVEFDWNTSGLVNPLDGPQEIAHPREAETIHTSQLGSTDASIDQQSSHSTHTTNDSDGKLADNANNNATTATSTVINTAATTALSSTLSTDSISHNINDNGLNVDIGVSDLSRNPSTNVAVNSITKPTIINTTTTDMSYNLTTTCSNNKDVHEILHDEVVATSTFAGPLKETHIYTPSKIDGAASATKTAIIATSKTTAPIDFDYEIAAAGIIIDETVVKKEYRDVEYNPGFSLDFSKTQPIDLLTTSDKITLNDDFFGPLQSEVVKSEEPITLQSADTTKATPTADAAEFDDEFSDFQSVPPSSVTSGVNITAQNSGQMSQTAALRTKDLVLANNASRTGTPTFGGREMILSPAILLPQAISMESNKPKIEWGDTTANINPEELARIEELFPQPKTDAANFHKSAPIPNGYQQQQPQSHKSLSISATIAQKELHVDDDDWSEFVSVPAQSEILAKPKPQAQYIPANNNNQFSTHPPVHRQQQRQQTTPFAAQKPKTIDATAFSADEEWSEFVSSAPPQHPTQYRAMPQFNSAAWKNANFYNNPLSFYQSQTQSQTHSNVVPKLNHHNNNSNTHLNYNNNYNKYNQQQQQQLQHNQHNQHAQQLQLQQQIHIMQDFSTAPPSPHRSSNAALVPNQYSSNAQFQVGSAKVAPSISLIPDLGFIAPAATTHTAFINTLPKSGLITKK